VSRGGRVVRAAAGGGVPAGALPPLRCAFDSSIVSRLCSGVGAASAAGGGPAAPPVAPGPCQPMAAGRSGRQASLPRSTLLHPHQAAALSTSPAAGTTRLAAASAARVSSHSRSVLVGRTPWANLVQVRCSIHELEGAYMNCKVARISTHADRDDGSGRRPPARAPAAGARPPTRTGVVDPSDRSSSAAAAAAACGGGGAAGRPAARPCACARPASGSRPLGGGGASRSQNDASSPAPGESTSARACARARARVAVRATQRAQSSAFCQWAMTPDPITIMLCACARPGHARAPTGAGAGSDAAAGRNVATMRCRSASTLSHSPWS